MKFDMGDVVRYKNNSDNKGLFEVAGYNLLGHAIITKDECDTETIEDDTNLILICEFFDRKDLQEVLT